MKKYKITPFLVDSKHNHEFYERLLNKGYQIKVWNKNEDKEIFDFFLPEIRSYMFWTFNLNEAYKFKSINSEMQSAVCNNYYCTMFEKDEIQVICFSIGIVLIIGDDEKAIKKIMDYDYIKDIEEININENKVYEIEVKDKKELYSYIICLYKYITLMKIEKEIDYEFNKTRKIYVDFIKKIYNKKVTDDLENNNLQNKWREDLGIDKVYISVENKFDLLYKNNKLNSNHNMLKIIIILLVVLIIISLI